MVTQSELQKYIDRLHREGFYGKVTLEFRAGDVMLIRREEAILTDKSDKYRRGSNGRNSE